MKRFRYRLLVVPFVVASVASTALAIRSIPDDNLGYPVLINVGTGTASGFYLNHQAGTFLVTAKHTFYSRQDGSLLSKQAVLVSYSNDPKDRKPNILHLNFEALIARNEVHQHPSKDLVMIRVATVTGSNEVRTIPGVTVRQQSTTGILGASPETLKRLEEVLVANDVFVFGYPTSLGLKEHPQLDTDRPLLRKGIVAGVNTNLRSIVIDCPVYPGNSGGPVLEIEQDGFRFKARIIGIVTEFVPSSETWLNLNHKYSNTVIGNSGYSIVIPADTIFEVLESITK